MKTAKFGFDASNMFQKSWDGTIKDWKSCVMKKKHLVDHLTINYFNSQQISDMTGYKKCIPERLSLSAVKNREAFSTLGVHGLHECNNLIMLPCKIAKNLGILSSALYNITKSFRES